jgi:hypothetical protein
MTAVHSPVPRRLRVLSDDSVTMTIDDVIAQLAERVRIL